MKSRITLICPTNAYGSSATSGIYYPMGILLVGSVAKKRLNCEIKLIDGEGKSISYLEKKLAGVQKYLVFFPKVRSCHREARN